MSTTQDHETNLLVTQIAGIALDNPVMVASGTFGYGREYATLMDIDRLGAIMVKGVSVTPWTGNPMPRIVETPAGMLNAIGLQNPGVAYFCREALPWLRQRKPAVIVNVIGKTVEEYAEVATRLDQEQGIAALEVNISCPNVKEGGIAFGTDPVAAAEVVAAVKASTSLPVIPKLSPNVTDITAMARAVVDAGASAVSLVNTFLGMAIDVRKKRPALANVMGGLSGPAIRPLAVRMVWQVYEAVQVPIIGMGGITCVEDALEFIMAGAGAVAVGTATFRHPTTALQVCAGLAAYCKAEGVTINELVGVAH
ncbi:MAG TPA: dihydroorotate dehydrogenase [Firmicutes bacterium]|jgi:dihydroorotate dehydrogenase (NAD+) catalytic subunit|nr:dihydroorotate dehydrogenase [Bacillota bacterium]